MVGQAERAAALVAATTLPELLADAAHRYADREALVVGPVRWTYRELFRQVNGAARALKTLGVQRGDTVALLAPNVSEWITVAFAALQLGARVDAFNTWVKAYDLDHLLASSGASVLVMADRVRRSDLVAELQTLIPDLTSSPAGTWTAERYPSLRHVVVLSDTVPTGAHSWPALATPCLSTKAEDDAESIEPDLSSADGAAFVLYTSGSTKFPKAVPLCHRDLVMNGFCIGERLELGPDDRVWFGSPLFWSYGCANALMATMSHGACFVLQEQFEPEAAAELMRAEQVTAAYVLPTMVDALCSAANGAVAEQIRHITSLRTGTTIGRPDEVRRAVEVLGIDEICNVYGSTETYGNCCVTPRSWPVERRRNCQGPPLDGVEVRIVDEATGAVLPRGSEGELQVRGRITPGYLGDDESNAAAFTHDGWYRSGDRMKLDEDGAVVFVGRTTDMIKTSGINVSPAEVEAFLSGHPDIAEVIVLGTPHATRGEVVIAFVVARSASLTAEDVREFCAGRVAAYKIPFAVGIVDELPRTGTGKLRRLDLSGAAAALVGRGGDA